LPLADDWASAYRHRYHEAVVEDPNASLGSEGLLPRRIPLGELLVQAKVITPSQLTEVLQVPRELGKKIGQLLIERGWLNEAQLTQTLSLQLSVPWVSLYHIDFSRQLLNRVARDVAERYCLIPIFVRHVKGQGETLYVAMDDPTNDVAIEEVSRQAGLPARPMIASATDIRSAIRVYYGEPEVRQTVETLADEHLDNVATEEAGKVPIEPDLAPEPAPNESRSVPPLPARRTSESSEAKFNEEEAVVAQSSAPPPSSSPAPPVYPTLRPTTEVQPTPPSVAEPSSTRRHGNKMIALTLLDGTTINLPSRPTATEDTESHDGVTARDYVSALRAAALGADAGEILGDKPQWEPVVAALLSILLRKGLIADREFIEELRKI
jgi:type IV pilus assembly protein PilB